MSHSFWNQWGGVRSWVALGALVTAGLGVLGVQASPARSGQVSGPEGHERRQLGGGKAVITHLARGQHAYLGRLTLKGGVNVPLHRDPTEEYLIIERGRGVIRVNGVEHKLSPGSVVYMPAGAEVSFTNSDEELVALQVFAGPESADKYLKWAPLKP